MPPSVYIISLLLWWASQIHFLWFNYFVTLLSLFFAFFFLFIFTHYPLSVPIYQRRIDLTLGMNNASRSALKQICGCWFSLYNGYCNGHENDSRPYFNSNSRLGHGGNEHLSIWTENPNHENDKKGFPYRDNNVVIHRNHSVSQNPYCDNNAVQQRRQGSRSGMNSHKNDSFYQEYITDDDCVSDEN